MGELGAFPLSSLLRYHRVIAIAVQLLLMALANWAAFILRFDGRMPPWAAEALWTSLPWLLAIRALTFIPFRLYAGLWKYTSLYDLQALVAGVAVSSAVFFVFTQTRFGPESYPRSIFIIDAVLLLLLLGGVRLSRRLWAELTRSSSGQRVLVIGAGDAGEMIVRDMKNDPARTYHPVGFVDDDRSKQGRRIHGLPVLGSAAKLPEILEALKPEEILIAMPGADPAAVRRIVRSLQPTKIPIKTLPHLRDLIDGTVQVAHIRNLAVEDLLARAPVGLKPEPVRALLQGRRVLVTGAGGSIGSEL